MGFPRAMQPCRFQLKPPPGSTIIAGTATRMLGKALRSAVLGGALCRLGLQPFVGLGLVDHEARMGAGADRLELVLGGHFEGNLAAVDRRNLRGDFHVHAEQCRCEVPQCDLHADRILAWIDILKQELAAGLLNVAYQKRRPVDATLLSHEVDGAVAIDLDAVNVRSARLEPWFHDGFPRSPVASLVRSRAQVKPPTRHRDIRRRQREARGAAPPRPWPGRPGRGCRTGCRSGCTGKICTNLAFGGSDRRQLYITESGIGSVLIAD